MTICSKCKKKYGTYPVILSNSAVSMAFEINVIQGLYYCEETDEGLCEPCREKLFKDDMWVWEQMLLLKLSLMSVVASAEKDGKKKSIKYFKEGLKHAKLWNKRLEKTPKVKAWLKKRNKEIQDNLEVGNDGMCTYCGEFKGTVTRPSPNMDDKWWKICRTCDRVIDLQEQQTMILHAIDTFPNAKNDGKLQKNLEKIKKELADIAHESSMPNQTIVIKRKDER